MKIITHNAKETQALAARLAKKIVKAPGTRKQATVIALVGELGAGKTTFVQGFAKGLGIKHRMVSPTFLIFRHYTLHTTRYKNFYHVDLYRIHNEKELDVLNFKSILHSPFNIVLIEWAEKIKELLPKDTIWIQFTHGRKENERTITYRR